MIFFSLPVRIKASMVASQLMLKCRGEDPLNIFPGIVTCVLSESDENLRRNGLLAISNIIYFKIPVQFDSILSFLIRQIESPNPKIRYQCLEGLSHIPQHGEEYVQKLIKNKIFEKINKLVM